MNVVGSGREIPLYRAAEMSIQTHSPEISINMQPVWDSMDLKNPLTYQVERMNKVVQQLSAKTEQMVRDGDRIKDSLVTKEKNAFGNIGLEKMKRLKQYQLQYMLTPSSGPQISVQTYEPEIQFEPYMLNLQV